MESQMSIEPEKKWKVIANWNLFLIIAYLISGK